MRNTKFTACSTYFQGVIKVLRLNRVGVYGDYNVCKYLKDNNLVTYIWETYAWSSGLWEPRRNIEQYLNGAYIGGVQVDLDHALTDNFGQWRIPMPFTFNPNVLKQVKDMYARSVSGTMLDSDISRAWLNCAIGNTPDGKKRNFGPATTLEYLSVDWNGKDTIYVVFQWAYAAYHPGSGLTSFYDMNDNLIVGDVSRTLPPGV